MMRRRPLSGRLLVLPPRRHVVGLTEGAALAAAAGAIAGAVVPPFARPRQPPPLWLAEAVVHEEVRQLERAEQQRLSWCHSSDRNGPRLWRRLELRHPELPDVCLASLEVTGTTIHSASAHEGLTRAAALTRRPACPAPAEGRQLRSACH